MATKDKDQNIPVRYLQLCAEDNIQVANCTTPAQMFHLLRRQVKRDFRKPLVVFTPKSLLRHKLAVSSVAELADGGFHEILDETAAPATAVTVEPKKVKHLLLCSGKVYYDLLAEREKQQCNDAAIVRMEQLYPFPEHDLTEVLTRYAQANDVVWVQEEPRNMGAWTFIFEHVSPLLRSRQTLRYAGRPAQASPAVGFQKIHQQQQMQLLNEALKQ